MVSTADTSRTRSPALSGELAYRGREADFPPGNRTFGTQARVWAIEQLYAGSEGTKLLVGGILNTLVRNANRVKIVCLAQLVNVIAPIMTNSKGSLRQAILYPYRFALQFARCNVLSLLVRDRPYSILGCCRYPRTEKSRASS